MYTWHLSHSKIEGIVPLRNMIIYALMIHRLLLCHFHYLFGSAHVTLFSAFRKLLTLFLRKYPLEELHRESKEKILKCFKRPKWPIRLEITS